MQCRIYFAISVWALVTLIAFFVIQKHKSEFTSILAGALFLIGASVATLFLPLFLGIQDSCITYACVKGDNMSHALVTLIIISWGAFGANLLSACISHKQE